MRFEDLRGREDAAAILTETLERGLVTQLGRAIRVERRWRRGAAGFVLVPWTGVICTRNASREVRRFISDAFRYTPVRRRAPLQFLLGSLLGSRAGVKSLGRSILFVEPRWGGVDDLAVVPGNQRIRVFDFGRGRCRVLLKRGFKPDAMRRDVSVRRGAGPWVPVLETGDDGSWFEEEIFEGYAVPRCPPWISRTQTLQRALAMLETWRRASEEEVEAEQYIESVTSQLVFAMQEIASRYGAAAAVSRRWIVPLAKAAKGADRVVLVTSQGDFQPGNVLVSRDGKTVKIIDWEGCERRSASYDRLVLGLQTRSGTGLENRLTALLGGKTLPWWDTLPSGREERRAAICLFVLEDLLWFAQDSLSGPLRRPSGGVLHYARALDLVGHGLT